MMMLVLCVITQCTCQLRRKGRCDVSGSAWKLKTVTCNPQNKISCFPLSGESRQLNMLFYRLMHGLQVHFHVSLLA